MLALLIASCPVGWLAWAFGPPVGPRRPSPRLLTSTDRAARGRRPCSSPSSTRRRSPSCWLRCCCWPSCSAATVGPQSALFAELFPAHVRYSGASLGYQIGAILGGGIAPFIATVALRVVRHHDGHHRLLRGSQPWSASSAPRAAPPAPRGRERRAVRRRPPARGCLWPACSRQPRASDADMSISSYYQPRTYEPCRFGRLVAADEALPVVVVGAGPVGMARRPRPGPARHPASPSSRPPTRCRSAAVRSASRGTASRSPTGSASATSTRRPRPALGGRAQLLPRRRRCCTSGWLTPTTTCAARWSTCRSRSSSRSWPTRCSRTRW